MQQRQEALLEIVMGLDDLVERHPKRIERVGQDLKQAVELRLEVVVQRSRADADVGGDVGPLGVLIALAAEVLGCGGEDVLALATGGSPGGALPDGPRS